MNVTNPALRFAVTAVLGFQAAACTDGGRESSVTIRDSVGVTIVENGAIDALPEAIRIAPEPLLDLGGNRGNPEQELDPQGPFHNAVRTSDGRYVAVSNRDLKVYGRDGHYIRTIGRPGDGPGEFGQVRSVCIAPGDTIAAIHYSRPSISIFDPEGEHVRTISAHEGYIGGSGCFDDGTLLVLSNYRANPKSALPAAQAQVLDRVVSVRRIASDGTELGSIGDFPGGTSNLYFQTIANVVPHGNSLYVGDGRIPELYVYAVDGELERVIRWSVPAVPVTAEMIEDRIRGSIPRSTSPSEVQQRLERGRSQPQPSTIPVYFHIMVDAGGRIWVQDHPIGADRPWPWTVFDPAGRALGRVHLPEVVGAGHATAEIRSIGRETVLLSWRDEELGFPHLTLHTLETLPGQ